MTYDHHPDPAIAYCIEVEEIIAEAHNLKIGFGEVDREALATRIFRAMQFRVGGDEGAIAAKNKLREIEAEFLVKE